MSSRCQLSVPRLLDLGQENQTRDEFVPESQLDFNSMKVQLKTHPDVCKVADISLVLSECVCEGISK